jgi:lipopolysaccharide transport system permease protein
MKLSLFWVQVRDLAVASLKSRYRKTFAGMVWVILNPLLLFGVQALVFKKFLNLQVPNYYLFLLSGLLPWIFFSQTIQMVTPIFVTQAQLLRSFKINPLVIFSSQVVDNFVNFLISFLLLLLPFYLSTSSDLVPLLLLPLAFIPLFLGTLGLGLVLATLNVFFRDTNFVMGFIFNLLFFLTPIFYPADFVPEHLRWIITFNPALYLLDPFRHLLYQGVEDFFISWIKGLGVGVGFVALSLRVWKRKINDFYHRL